METILKNVESICLFEDSTSDSLYSQPGFKLLHIADVDYETNYVTFLQALTEIKMWSDNNPLHTTIFINIEVKSDSPGNYSRVLRLLGFKKGIPLEAKLYSDLDKEILALFKQKDLPTPMELKGENNDINQRLTLLGWPTLNSCLGKTVFILDGDKEGLYMKENSSEERPMFVYGEAFKPQTAFVVINDPIGKEDEIKRLSDFYMVRTRTDAGTIEARNNDYTRFNSVMESKAQIITSQIQN